jgi:hypothetical protein
MLTPKARNVVINLIIFSPLVFGCPLSANKVATLAALATSEMRLASSFVSNLAADRQ